MQKGGKIPQKTVQTNVNANTQKQKQKEA